MIIPKPRPNHTPVQTATYSDLKMAKTIWQLSCAPIFPVIEVENDMLQFLNLKEWHELYFNIDYISQIYTSKGVRGYPARIHYALYCAEFRILKWIVKHAPLTHDPMYLPQWRRLKWR